MTSISSPYASGGGGVDFESEVGAYYLALLLLGGLPRGQDAGVVKEVKFQRLYEGEPLDDLIVLADISNGTSKLALQMKRDIAFGNNDTFNRVVEDCWQTFKAPAFVRGLDRFGLVTGLYNKDVDEHYQSALTWARTSSSADDFFTRINRPKLSSQTQRTFIQLIRGKLEALHAGLNDNDLWHFLKSMVILHFDFQREGSRDKTHTEFMLRQLLSQQTEASGFYEGLCTYAARGKRTAGSYNREILLQELQLKFPVLPTPDYKNDIEKLKDHAGFVLGDIHSDISGLQLYRSELMASIEEKIDEGGLIEIVGRPGVGKSAILKALAEKQQGQGFSIVLSGDRLIGNSWNNFASTELRLEHPIDNLLIALGSSTHPCIFIDGIDKVPEQSRRAINDLLRVVARISLGDEFRKWTIIFTSREEMRQEVYGWLEIRAFGQPKTFSVPELSNEELQILAEYSSSLKTLLVQQRLAPVARNLFMLELIEKSRVFENIPTEGAIITEVEVSKVWWENYVGSSGGVRGQARKDELRKYGKQVVSSYPLHWVANENSDPEILLSLVRDRILLKDTNRDVYRFAHDTLEDWVISRILNERRESLVEYLLELGQPLGLFKAVQFLGTYLLESKEVDAWEKLLESTERSQAISPKWRQALLLSPLLSPRTEELLKIIETIMISTDAVRLNDLMVALRTVQVLPDFSLLVGLEEKDWEPSEVMTLAYSRPIPQWQVWQRFMGWLLGNARQLTHEVRDEIVKVMEIWQTQAPAGSIYRREIAEISLEWLQEVESWRERNGS